MYTNIAPMSVYRGARRPKATTAIGMDIIGIRQKNAIGADAMPYTSATTLVYDSGDFGSTIAQTCDAADWDGYADRANPLPKDKGAAGR